MIRILVVDDRPDVRLSFLYLLEASGYDVAEAADGTQALSVMARKHIDVILTDLYMPGLDGLGLVRIVRNGPPPQPRIIAMSGSDHIGRDASLEAARVLGADAILTKPFSRDLLVRTIRAVLSQDAEKT
jgi:two-component system phosphate regulon response regulator PhoB